MKKIVALEYGTPWVVQPRVYRRYAHLLDTSEIHVELASLYSPWVDEMRKKCPMFSHSGPLERPKDGDLYILDGDPYIPDYINDQRRSYYFKDCFHGLQDLPKERCLILSNYPSLQELARSKGFRAEDDKNLAFVLVDMLGK